MSDGFYRAFEGKYRGSRELIKERICAYLPFILLLKEIYPNGLVLDSGCGRGEWLELLKENDIHASGVDLDEEMLSACIDAGFDVINGDAIDTLKKQADESLICVSAFHMVEHIPFDVLQVFVAEALRALKPGGLLIMETPNPENIKVATENFYLDATHIRPIPSGLLSFLPEFHGFERTKVLRLQENKALITQEKISLADVIDGASPDYAVIAQKKAGVDLLKKFDDVFSQELGLPLTSLVNKFDSRLLKIEVKAGQAEAKAGQAEAKAGQAEAKAEQLHTELQDVYASRSWRITAPLRWFIHQVKLLRQYGLFSRIKALVKKITCPFIRRAIAFIASRPELRFRLVRLVRRLGLYGFLKPTYLHISRSDQPVPPSSTQASEAIPDKLQSLPSTALRIYAELKTAVEQREKESG